MTDSHYEKAASNVANFVASKAPQGVVNEKCDAAKPAENRSVSQNVAVLMGDTGLDYFLFVLKISGFKHYRKGTLGPLPTLDEVLVSVSANWDNLTGAEKMVIRLILEKDEADQGTTPTSEESLLVS